MFIVVSPKRTRAKAFAVPVPMASLGRRLNLLAWASHRPAERLRASGSNLRRCVSFKWCRDKYLQNVMSAVASADDWARPAGPKGLSAMFFPKKSGRRPIGEIASFADGTILLDGH